MSEGVDIVAKREKTHGDFASTAVVAQALKNALRAGPSWHRLSDVQREALDGRAVKLARIVCGDPNFPDHWDDDDGYRFMGAPE
ncbi:hypothetical protein [Methylocystis sp.]|uniref:hypothetical protein n=1 Tax=Methylocystis sp. TaxID=1911079 RepID=UPI00273777B3|nr:hypothetical protein [Methylocystis sp.]MDP3554831.1 hypothetical protein [Methylocystis sp.]